MLRRILRAAESLKAGRNISVIGSPKEQDDVYV